jgi:hypothetical protein
VVSDEVLGNGMNHMKIHWAVMQTVEEIFESIQGLLPHFLEKFICNENGMAQEICLF